MSLFDTLDDLVEAYQEWRKPATAPGEFRQALPEVKMSSNGDMQMSPQGIVELANYEALARTKYIDSGGVQTIGIGMTTSEIKDLKSWGWDKTLSVSECVKLYTDGLKKYVAAVNKVLTRQIPQHQFDVLCSITYNIGTGAMAGSTFMKRVNAGYSDAQICEALQRFKYDNGKVVKGLINRRVAESKLFITGKYSHTDGTVGLIKVNPTTHKPIYTNERVEILSLLS